MKFAALVLIFASFTAARAESIFCQVQSLNKTTGTQVTAELKDIEWGKEFTNAFELSNGEKGSFTVQTQMTSPDTGVEFISIQNQKDGTCKESFLFKNNQEGQSIYSGVNTTCQASDAETLSVSCWWM